MKFFHIADVHLGAEPDKGYPWSEERGLEIWESFRKVIQQAGAEGAGLFLIAGDLFHRQPLLKELKKINEWFASVPKTEFVLIAGNHDYIRKHSPVPSMKWAENVHWLHGDTMDSVSFPKLGVRVWGFSYHAREMAEARYDNMRVTGDMPVNILLAHGGDEKHIPISRETFVGTGFDYIALGHIHKPQVLEANRIAYAGSLEPLDKNETGAHGYIRGECAGGKTRIAFVPFAVREYKKLKIQIKDTTTQFTLENTVKKAIEEKGRQNLYSLYLEGKRSPDTEFLTDRLYGLGNIREAEDRTRPAYSIEALKEKYPASILSEYIALFRQEEEQEAGETAKDRTAKTKAEGDGSKEPEMEKALAYGIEALLASGEERV